MAGRAAASRQQDLDLEVRALLAKITHSEDRLYGGTVTNTKELSELQAEVASLRRRQQRLEDVLLQAMIEVDEAEENLAETKHTLNRVEDAWSEEQTALSMEQETLGTRLAELGEQRNILANRLSPHELATYTSLRKRKGGVAVAQVSGNACSACGVSVSAGRKYKIREGELVACSNCERILVAT
jgi:predicted  nucleic acid-binding Zn-ribbon protein